MSQGWIKLYRKIRSSWLWAAKPFSKCQAFIDLLLMANHQTADVLFRDSLYRVESGTFITSELKLSENWGWSRGKTRRFLSDLETAQTIRRKTDKRKVRITIVNWASYQNAQGVNDTTGETRDDTSGGQQTDINKNEKNEKNDKNVKNIERPNANAFRLAELLLNLILERKPDFKRPDLRQWEKHVERMIRLDKRMPERIEAIIHWCQRDSFWQANILSTAKLREKFDQLELKMKSTKQSEPTTAPLFRCKDGQTPREKELAKLRLRVKL
jgi:hypothetical protein